MPKLRIFLAVGVALSAACLSACTSTGNGAAPDLALNTAPVDEQSADFPLPETVAVLPSSYAPVEGAPVPLMADATAALPEGQLPPPTRPGDPMLTAPQKAGGTQVASLEPMMPASAYATADAGPAGPAEIEQLIQKYAAMYEVPADLVRRVVKRESTFNPSAYNRGHWGLMQIKHSTARGMGYDGPARGLLDAETNLKYSVKYLRGAFLVAKGDQARADRLYQRGYYYDAKRMGLLGAAGMSSDRHRMRSPGEEQEATVAAQVEFPPTAEVIPASMKGQFPPAPPAPGPDDMPVITPATAPVPSAAPAKPSAAGAA
ncbi:soluble lytic murein transglycosylase-like protein [Mesorhizobium soli]|uniref:lytic transglycosylase domain-containing protein n=1 Tax=Pseudaminobacter soli (ex Li et al. 2025) TaxID=1295366 RepID=UPI002473F862|nr:lytic transglycosylase domain-containing protein [Mesorhizobium soli]MDH6234316.1 soluble lytic murein transglycosylase-like protein [Mesorhizobium soli]